jgi:excisionase family DNA binding protein
MDKNDYVRISEIPNLLPISTVTARRLIAARRLPSIRIGRQIFVERRVLEQWLANGGNSEGRRAAHQEEQ